MSADKWCGKQIRQIIPITSVAHHTGNVRPWMAFRGLTWHFDEQIPVILGLNVTTEMEPIFYAKQNDCVCFVLLKLRRHSLQDRYLRYLSYGSMICDRTVIVLCDWSLALRLRVCNNLSVTDWMQTFSVRVSQPIACNKMAGRKWQIVWTR